MEVVVDFANPKEKWAVLDMIRQLDGPHRVEVVKYRKRHTDQQRRYYFPAVVNVMADYLRAQGCPITAEACHEMLKFKFLRESVVDPGTGEVVGERVRSTTELDIDEFGTYLDNCIGYLAETFGVEVAPPCKA